MSSKTLEVIIPTPPAVLVQMLGMLAEMTHRSCQEVNKLTHLLYIGHEHNSVAFYGEEKSQPNIK